MTELHGKVAIVLGASTPGGMGEAIVRRLAREGATVVVSARSRERIAVLAADVGGSALAADITDERQIAALVAHALNQHGRLDIAVNAVGVTARARIAEMTPELLLQMAALHFVGPALFIKHVAEVLPEWAPIVNISSLSVYDTMSNFLAYSASKAAGDRLIRGAAVEYRHKRLRINGLVPSMVLSHMSRHGSAELGIDVGNMERDFVRLTPLGRLATPDDIAAMVFAMVRDEYFESGQIVHCSGGNSLMGHPRYLA